MRVINRVVVFMISLFSVDEFVDISGWLVGFGGCDGVANSAPRRANGVC